MLQNIFICLYSHWRICWQKRKPISSLCLQRGTLANKNGRRDWRRSLRTGKLGEWMPSGMPCRWYLMIFRLRYVTASEELVWPSGKSSEVAIRRLWVPFWPLSGSVLEGPEFNSSTTLVNNQLVCLRPVGILSPVMSDLNYLFQAFAPPH